MTKRIRPTAVAVSMLVAVLVFAAAVAEAIREGSWGPIWALGWLPAVLVGVVHRPAGRRRCLPARLRRSER